MHGAGHLKEEGLRDMYGHGKGGKLGVHRFKQKVGETRGWGRRESKQGRYEKPQSGNPIKKKHKRFGKYCPRPDRAILGNNESLNKNPSTKCGIQVLGIPLGCSQKLGGEALLLKASHALDAKHRV